MDKKTSPACMVSIRDPSQIKRYTETQSKGMEKDTSCKWKRKRKAEVTTFISDKIDFKT